MQGLLRTRSRPRELGLLVRSQALGALEDLDRVTMGGVGGMCVGRHRRVLSVRRLPYLGVEKITTLGRRYLGLG